MIISPLTWFKGLRQRFTRCEPQNKQELLDGIRYAYHQHSLLTADTLAMMEGALQMSEMHVRDIMVPRAQMITLPLDCPPQELTKLIISSGHSRFPVIGEDKDDVQGIFLAKDLLDYYANGGSEYFSMRDRMRPVVFIPESKRLNVLLREFRTSRNHMAIVVNEYSGAAGLVTIEDVIEQIVGDIDDEHDIDDENFITPRDDFFWVWALTPIEEFNEFFKTNFSDEEFDTVGGLITQLFGHVPKRGEKLMLGGLEFEVMRSNNRRIVLLRVKSGGLVELE
jgi:magnesium and cobalt transporter